MIDCRPLLPLLLLPACATTAAKPSPAAPSSSAAATPATTVPATTTPATTAPATAPAAPGPAARLYDLLIGAYDSADQAARDAEFRTIHLAICPVDAPELGDRVLYVEQAAAEDLDRPYRQRLYIVEEGAGPGEARSRVFELRDPGAHVGLCGRGERRRFAAAEAEERRGCAVTLVWRPEATAFVGATHGHDCASNLRGAAYATSEVRVEPGRLVSWDRGYDAAGAQVWGAVKGPYEFTRRTSTR
jgi:hypothetical protein